PTLRTALTASEDAGPTSLTPELLRMIGSMPMQKVLRMLDGTVPAALFDSLMQRTRDIPTDPHAGGSDTSTPGSHPEGTGQ
ncbi:hypothetical protein D3I60_01645, partial [Brevibacterium permense]|uniref:hypothetical protein n=1 Tax=Brevibacterium permense TaxID=234834 RepID=UPI0021D24577